GSSVPRCSSVARFSGARWGGRVVRRCLVGLVALLRSLLLGLPAALQVLEQVVVRVTDPEAAVAEHAGQVDVAALQAVGRYLGVFEFLQGGEGGQVGAHGA